MEGMVMVKVLLVVRVRVVVTVETVVRVETVVAISVVVSVLVLGESEPVAKSVMKIKAAPTTIPTMSKAAPVVWLDAFLRIGEARQTVYSKPLGERTFFVVGAEEEKPRPSLGVKNLLGLL